MVEPPAGVAQAGSNIFTLQIGKLPKDLFVGQSGRQQVQDIDDTNPHAANARASATLLGIDSDALVESGHHGSSIANFHAFVQHRFVSLPHVDTRERGNRAASALILTMPLPA